MYNNDEIIIRDVKVSDIENIKTFFIKAYGTHTIFGQNSLLYIGKAEQQKFKHRFIQHKEWMHREISDLEIYIGRIGGVNPPLSDKIWTESIDCAEKLLIYFSFMFINF